MTKRRKYRPLKVERDACLLALGLNPDNFIMDHQPPLAMRDYDEATGLYEPAENDPRYMVPLSPKANATKTYGKKHDVSDGDIHKIAKAKRIRQRELLRTAAGEPTSVLEAATSSKPRKFKIPSRPMPKGRPFSKRREPPDDR